MMFLNKHSPIVKIVVPMILELKVQIGSIYNGPVLIIIKIKLKYKKSNLLLNFLSGEMWTTKDELHTKDSV